METGPSRERRWMQRFFSGGFDVFVRPLVTFQKGAGVVTIASFQLARHSTVLKTSVDIANNFIHTINREYIDIPVLVLDTCFPGVRLGQLLHHYCNGASCRSWKINPVGATTSWPQTKLSKDCSCSGFNFWIFGSDSAAIRPTELQLKLPNDINVIVLSHSLCLLIDPTKMLGLHRNPRPSTEAKSKLSEST